MQSRVFRGGGIVVNTLLVRIRLWQNMLVLFGIVSLWYIVCRLFRIPEYILPVPMAVANGFGVYRTILAQNGLFTLLVMTSGLAIGSTSGVAIGVLASENEWVRKTVSPIVIAIQSIPKLALAPLLLL